MALMGVISILNVESFTSPAQLDSYLSAGICSRRDIQQAPHVLSAFISKKNNQKKFRNFDEMLSQVEQPVLVNFSTSWCGPCKLMEKELHKTSEVLGADNVQVTRVNTEKFPSLSSRFGIDALPTTILFQEGKPVHKFVGVVTAAELVEQLRFFLEDNINSAEQIANGVGDMFLDSI